MLQGEFKTKDLYEAAFLYASGVKLTGLESDGKQMLFVFIGGEANQTSDDYWSKSGMVVAKDYADAIRSLKDRLFARG